MASPVNTYLSAYNLLLAIAWAVFFVHELVTGFAINTPAIVLISIAQWAAVLEILHAALGWVRSSVMTTFIQVLSRVFVVVLLYLLPHQLLLTLDGISGWHLIVGAWCITEIIRYSFYFLLLQKKEWQPLTWLRYSLFSILYPVGVIGELLIVISVMNWVGWQWSAINIFLGVVLVAYLIFFPQLYGYMWTQRNKKLAAT